MGRTIYYRDRSWWSIIALACVGTSCSSHSYNKNLLSVWSHSADVLHLFCSHGLIRTHWRCYLWSAQELWYIPSPLVSLTVYPRFLEKHYQMLHWMSHLWKDIDPRTWGVKGFVQNPTSSSLSLTSNELPIAEKLRLAFAERDARLAPKRAKNARQRQRRAERDWMMSDDNAKAMLLASKATRYLHKS